MLDFGFFRSFIWLGYCLFFVFKEVVGRRYFVNICLVYCSGTEFIEVVFLKVIDFGE